MFYPLLLLVPLRSTPKYNQKRRHTSQIRPLGQRCASLGRLSESINNSEDLELPPITVKSSYHEVNLKPSNGTDRGRIIPSSSGFSLCNEQEGK